MWPEGHYLGPMTAGTGEETARLLSEGKARCGAGPADPQPTPQGDLEPELKWPCLCHLALFLLAAVSAWGGSQGGPEANSGGADICVLSANSILLSDKT